MFSTTHAYQKKDRTRDRQNIPNLLLLLLAIAFVLRIFLVLYPEIIYSDGVEYIRCAKLILSGNWGGSKAPPFYPVLIALASRFTSNLELAGIWVSVIFGTALLLPVFYLGREIFNEKIGILSALFAAVHPYLYVSSGSVLTESVYHFLLTTAVLFGWRAFRRGKIRDILLFSFLTALAYFTRPEAIGFLFIFGFWALFIRPPEEKRHALKRVWMGALAILCFLAFSSPYLYQMRKETGRWELSKKFSISIGSVSEGESVPLEDFTRTKKITLVSFLVEPVTVLKKLGLGGVQALYRFQLSFHPLLFVLALIGFVWSMREMSFRKGSFYLLSYFIFYLELLLPFLWIARRYTAMISPIALPWASLGFVGLTGWIAPRLKTGGWKRAFPVLSLLLVLIVIFIQGRVVHGRGHRMLHKEVGLWMKDHLSKNGNVMMSRLPQIGFYAEMPWVIMPDKSYEEIMERAHSKGIRYLIIDEKVREPAVFLRMAEGGLIRIRDWRGTGEWLILFEVRPALR